MSAHLRDISLDLSEWKLYKTVEPFRVLGVPMINLRQLCYETEINGETISAGVFEYKDKRTHIAWGIKSEPHCSFHALALADGSWGLTIEGCPEYQVLRRESMIAGFSVDGSIFAADIYQTQPFLQKTKEKLRQFAPLILFIGLAILWASVKLYLSSTLPDSVHMTMDMNTSINGHAIHEWMLDFMGGFFLIFGALKAARLKKFAIAFSGYDVVAMRFKAWGYLYPFVELGLGILYTARLLLPFAYALTMVVMFVGCVGIYLKLQKKEEVVCACLGGFFDIPLTEVTLFENFLMANMALVMLMFV